MPQRYLRSRRSGARLPLGVIDCTRGSHRQLPRWRSNPFALQHTQQRWKSRQLNEVCVLLFEAYYEQDAAYRARVKAELRGKDLACNCRLDWPCHVDVLLMWANRDTSPEEP